MSKIKVGIQTIVWEELRSQNKVTRRDIFKQAKEAGYDGVELFEPPGQIDVKQLMMISIGRSLNSLD